LNPVALHIATGGAFFSGLALVSGCTVPALWLRKPLHRRLLGIFAALGFAFFILSSPPVWLPLYIAWIAAAGGAFAFAAGAEFTKRFAWARPWIAGVLVALSLGLCIAEARHRGMPGVEAPPERPVYVIGDSLSAGMGAGMTLWPEVYARRSGRRVVNLAEPGATLKSARGQAAKLPGGAGVVVLEIGGNDLLGGAGSAEFRDGLKLLLAAVAGDGRRLVMFELPLPPFHAAFGKAQRSLAAEYGAAMIPKRCLGAAFGMEGATLDGLHFSQVGHDHMAELMVSMVREAAPASD
jgi:acyl-CoA thioesterase-1